MGILKYDHFLYTPQHTWQLPPQLWRLVTGFFIARPGLGLIFDTYFMYMYVRSLETGHPRLSRRADVIWYLMFVGATILVGLSELCSLHLPVKHTCNTSYICPDSALPLQLSRFLEMRKITLVLRSSHHSQNSGLDCGTGMVGCLYGWLARL